ncbi:MAG: carboxypeptidase-like regulatory domain-containing protein [Ramlibacter sp.]|nr:carboxypeptidase-like regulatory domain-containing protein [Ramlibacter sp.]
MPIPSLIRWGAAASFALLLITACGGGGGGGSGEPLAGAGSISGSVTKGPVANATVVAYGIAGGTMGAQLGSATTDARGSFTLTVGAHAGPVMLRVNGGSYKDEATGTAMAMGPGDVMTAVMPGMVPGANVSGIQVTPLTSMAQARAQFMAGGMTAANIAAANAAMGNYFMVSDILHVHPMNPLAPGSGAGAGADARNYGMTLAAMSQYARSLDMPFSSAMVALMMGDASDGTMDGMYAGSRIAMPMGGMMGSGMMASTAGTSGLSTAMAEFMASAANMSGLAPADMAALMQRLAGSTGAV